MVSRSGKQFGASVGACAGDQAADVARNLRTVDDVLSRNEPHSISLCRSAGRNAFDVCASRHGIDFFSAPRRHAQGMGAMDRQDSRARRTEGEVAKKWQPYARIINILP